MSLFDDATLILTPNGYSESELFTIKPTGLTSTLTVVGSTTQQELIVMVRLRQYHIIKLVIVNN